MPKVERRGTGVMEQNVMVYDLTDPNDQPGKHPSFRENMTAILKASGFPYDEQVGSYVLPKDCPDNSAEFIAHAWLEAHGKAEHHRAEIERGEAGLYAWPCLLAAVEEMGVQRERLWWRCVKRDDGVSPERLALRGQKVAGGSRNAAHKTNEKHRSTREARFARMATLIESIGVDSAAAQCESEGLGGRDAIKRQWNRHKKGTPRPLSRS